MSEQTMSTSKEKEQSEFSPKNKINIGNKIINSKKLKNKEDDEDLIFNYSNDLLNENIKLSPMINKIPCFTIRKENSPKEEISTQNTFYSNITKNLNINNSYNIIEENLKEKTKILNRNVKKTFINNYIKNNNIYFRQYSPNYQLDNKNKIIYYSNKSKLIPNKINFGNYISNKKKFINNVNKKKKFPQKNIITGIKKHKLLTHLYFSTDNFYDSNVLDEKIEKLEEKKEQKRIKMKLLGQKINVATMKIEILQNYKKNKNINTIKKQIEYNKIYCNNDLKRLKDNYYMNINFHMNQLKYMKMKLLQCHENYITIKKHSEEIKKEELKFKIKKMELIEKILYLKKKLKDKLKPDINKNDNYNLDDTLEEKTINNISYHELSNLKDTINNNLKNTKNIKINNKNVIEGKIIKMSKQQINFFKAKFISNVRSGK